MIRKITEYISLFLLLSVACIAVFFIMSNAEWILGDNYSFILSTAQGRAAPLLNGANIGGSRFFPLAGLDFNILILFPGGNTAFAHYLYVSITFLAAYLFFFLFSNKSFSDSGTKALRENAFCLAAICCFMIVANGGFFTTMMNVIYSERQIFMVFALMILSFLYGRKSGNSLWFVLAAVSAIYSSYLKETVAPALLCFSLSSLLLFRKDMCKCEKMAHYAIIANFILFITLWFCFGMAGMTGGETYHLDEKMTLLKLLKTVLWQWKIYLVILSMSVFRIFSIAFFKNNPVYPYDTLLFTSAIFVCEYIVLGFNSDYYYFPALVFGLPALAYFLVSARDYASTIISAKRRIFFAVFASLMAVFEQLLQNSRTGHAARPARTVRLVLIDILVHGGSVRQVTLIRQTVTQVRHALTDHLEFQSAHIRRVREIHEGIGLEMTRGK